MEQFKSWDELSRKEQLAATHYDFYKDVHGIRPRWMNYDAMTEAELEAEMESLGKESDAQAIREKAEQEQAAHNFEMRIQSLLMAGAKDREQALRWVHEAEGSNGDDEYLCYLVGLPYSYFRQAA